MNNKLQFTSHERRATRDEFPIASALIIAVILTSLLAIIGVMFVMIARVDKMATSAISENKELNFAVEAVVAKISQELVLDVPGVAGAEYYDYPDTNNAWLASLEPYEKTAGNYYWRRISDIYNRLDANNLQAEIIADYQQNIAEDVNADADGDGVADSKWVELDDVNSNKGKPIYAAIRIVDNGGMINVNTAYKFNPNETDPNLIDGSSQMQMNLMAFSWGRAHTTYNASAETDLLEARANYGVGVNPMDLDEYEKNVIWRYNEPNGIYTPFDISDELELRYRFLINHKDIDSRLEELGLAQGRSWEFRTIYDFRTPAETGDLAEWFISSYDDGSLDPNYAYRHIGTIYNMDRIIRPDGGKMLNINDINDANNVSSVYNAIIDANLNIRKEVAAQIAVNLKDYIDSDSDVTPFAPDVNSPTYYGFERPCVYISELAYRFKTEPTPGGTGPGPPPPSPYTTYRSYAIELHKPYTEDNYPEPNQWRLDISGYTSSPVDVNWSGTKQFHVIYFADSCCTPLPINFVCDDSKLFCIPTTITINPLITVFTSGGVIELQRKVGANWISVDSVDVPGWLVDVPPGQVNPETTRSFKRDITLHKCIRRLWDVNSTMKDALSLGQRDPTYDSGDPNIIQAHPEDKPFTNIGEIGMLFRKDVYSDIVKGAVEADVRLNLTDPNFQQLFKYLTVFDPAVYSWNDPNETRIKGRININTAPWFVIAQLPWMRPEIAQVVVSHRDTPGVDGFKNIGALMQVGEMGYYANDTNDLTGFPDLTASDGAKNDFEERDVIFARISNLVTVRSDVFTAYILVRIGTDGPQKRVMAILDRSNVYTADGKVRVIALHPVPDSR